ncbi:MAG: protease HtpX, partial [Candidatus Obscuribacterales bacterium]|nr:protease HtpX [Candidatus Obscuribacterales bacterium]
YLTEYGLDYTSLAITCLFYGFAGSFISLLMSRAVAKWTCGIKLINANEPDQRLRGVYLMVQDLSRKAGLPAMPEVGFYESPEINAFATGPTKSKALVAVSTGLLSSMTSEEVEGVLGHEISHIANGDMVTMTLLQGLVNAFVMFLARAVAYAITRGGSKEGGGSSLAFFLVTMVLQVAFMFLGMIVINWFSRLREYRADAGSASLAGKEKMVRALERLKQNFDAVDSRQTAMATLQISSKPEGIMSLIFASHPPLEERIKRLQES